MIEYINQLRARRKGMVEESKQEHIIDAAIEGAVLRLRPIMMTMLVATLGLLPAALSHAIGSDSQRPFAIVIVGGLLANLVQSASFCCLRCMSGSHARTMSCRR
jgi:cobalt-zinc-cadmium resistance protein CzcA